MARTPAIRIIVLGTGDFALPMFDHLCDSGHQVVALLTQPDRPQGRKQELIPSQIKQSALARGIAVLQPENVNAQESLEQIRQLRPDLMVTAAYGQILSPELLAIPILGGINLHGSILPAYRGAAPVARAIQHGETETGVTVIRITPRIDAGGMIAVARTPIGPDETAGELEHRLAMLGAPLIAPSDCGDRGEHHADHSPGPVQGNQGPQADARKTASSIGPCLPRPFTTSFAPCSLGPSAPPPGSPRDPSSKGPLRLLIHQTRPIESPNQGPPGTVVESLADRLIVAAGTAAVRLLVLQLPGKKPLAAADFLRGHRVQPGDVMKS